jgi:opacity protein-like surface antigen
VNGDWGYVSGRTTETFAGGPFDGVTTSPPFSINRVVGGGQAGANYQINQYVFGIEGDFDWWGNPRNLPASMPSVISPKA